MRIHLLAFLVCLSAVGWGQPTYISGVVNTYHKVTTITNTEAFILDNVDGLKEFDKVLIVQMKGASVVTTVGRRTPPYGTISNLNGAGNYEVATICKIDAGTKTITLVHKLLNSYNVDYKVQLVKIARYETAIVNGELKAAEWVNATGTGGVLAIMANELILNAPVSADGKGYKGGWYQLTSGEYCQDDFATEYNYDPTPFTYSNFIFKYPNTQLGARKGESIVDPDLVHQGGKGAMATGGGGGNNHNTAGGGGSNAGAGGTGGNNTSMTANNVPVCISDHAGIGGYALAFDANRLFMGGGGGAGHGNNTAETGGGGGNGGGIVFIVAGSLQSNGKTISANGGTGLASRGDGASGGGGGGSIILNVSRYLDAPFLSAEGGTGGAVNNENIEKRCYGEGGGGGGGAIYFSGAKQGTTSVQGGAKGARILSMYCTVAGTATNGINGSVYENYPYRQSSSVLSSCPEWHSLPVDLLYFKVTQKEARTAVEWKVANPQDAYQYVVQRRSTNSDWQNIQVLLGESETTLFQRTDGPLATGIYLYRLKIVEKDRSVSYSPIQQITIKAEDINRLTIYPNPATNEVAIITPVKADEWLNIYDMKSRLVYRKKLTAGETLIRQDISFLSEGVYMIQVGKLTARFVVFK